MSFDFYLEHGASMSVGAKSVVTMAQGCGLPTILSDYLADAYQPAPRLWTFGEVNSPPKSGLYFILNSGSAMAVGPTCLPQTYRSV